MELPLRHDRLPIVNITTNDNLGLRSEFQCTIYVTILASVLYTITHNRNKVNEGHSTRDVR
jgi:hypothetical protein